MAALAALGCHRRLWWHRVRKMFAAKARAMGGLSGMALSGMAMLAFVQIDLSRFDAQCQAAHRFRLTRSVFS